MKLFRVIFFLVAFVAFFDEFAVGFFLPGFNCYYVKTCKFDKAGTSKPTEKPQVAEKPLEGSNHGEVPIPGEVPNPDKTSVIMPRNNLWTANGKKNRVTY